MSWTAPPTAVANTAYPAGTHNLGVRDNLNETAPAKATIAGRIFVTTGVNSIAEREIVTATVPPQENTANTSYVNLTTLGPTVSTTTGPRAFCIYRAALTNSTVGEASLMSVEVSGATAVSANDAWALHLRSYVYPGTQSASDHNLFASLNPGINTFTAKYRCAAGTGYFQARTLTVIAL